MQQPSPSLPPQHHQHHQQQWTFDDEDATLGHALMIELSSLQEVEFCKHDVHHDPSDNRIKKLVVRTETAGSVTHMKQALSSLLNKIRLIKSTSTGTGGYTSMDVEHTEEEWAFDITAETHVMNMIRRTIIADVPTMAIDLVYFETQSSPVNDQVLTHAIGLLPVFADPRKYVEKQNCTCDMGCPDCEIEFTLDVEGPKVVYSHDFHSSIGTLMPNIFLIVLEAGNKIKLTCKAHKNKPSVHTKWASTSCCVFVPHAIIPTPAAGAQMPACPTNVFDMEDSVVVVKNPQACTRCGKCQLDIKNSEKWYRFKIESVGQIAPELIFSTALDMLEAKCLRYVDKIPDTIR